MKTRNLLIINVFVLLSIAFSSYAQTINEWRGLGRTGVYNESGLLKVWTENGP